MSKVVHLSDDAHAKAKEFCKAHGLKMSDWVASLIDRALGAGEQEEGVPEPVSFPTRREVAAPAGAAEATPEVVEATPAPVKEQVEETAAAAPEEGAASAQSRQNLHALVTKKKTLEKLDEQKSEEPDDGVPAYAKPPFWSSAK